MSQNPNRMTIVSFEDMDLFNEYGSQNVLLTAGVPTEVTRAVFESIVKITGGVKEVTPQQPVAPAELVVPEVVEVNVDRPQLLVDACRKLIKRNKVRRDFTPTGLLRVSSIREIVGFDFRTQEARKAQTRAEFELKQEQELVKERWQRQLMES